MKVSDFADLNGLVEYPKEGILSKYILKSSKVDITLFCMAKSSEISEHTSKKEGLVFVLEGSGTFNLKGKRIRMKPDVIIHMKKSAVHSLKAAKNTSFILFLFS
jgi:nitric oxide dioxygenase